MKLIVNKDGLQVQTEGVTDEVFIEQVLGLEKPGDAILLLRKKRDAIPDFEIVTAPQPDRIVSVKVEIKGHGDQARFHAVGKTLNDQSLFGSGSTLQEAVGQMLFTCNGSARLGIKVDLPCNARYHEAGLK